jgi:5-methylcytosine-specific restriction protein A
VTAPGVNADWSWDEHVLALQLYMDQRHAPLTKGSPSIAKLSTLLKKLGEKTEVARTPKFRNENGVYMKLMNFRRLDPDIIAKGNSGLSQGSLVEEKVWNKYSNDISTLATAAAATPWG